MQVFVASGVLIALVVAAGWMFVLEIRRMDRKYELYCERTGRHVTCRACGERFSVQMGIERCPMCGMRSVIPHDPTRQSHPRSPESRDPQD